MKFRGAFGWSYHLEICLLQQGVSIPAFVRAGLILYKPGRAYGTEFENELESSTRKKSDMFNFIM